MSFDDRRLVALALFVMYDAVAALAIAAMVVSR